MYRYGIFQGGGVKGLALVGALEVAEKQGVAFEGVGGASAGAIVAALYAAGYTAAEMRLLLEGLDFQSLLDSTGWAPYALPNKLGLYQGKKFQSWMYTQLARKEVRLFKDCSKKLRIVATDLTARTLVVLKAEDYPELEVAEAIRMSMSIPIVFAPVKMGRHLMVDGGVLSNFPLSLFDSNETLGFRLVAKSKSVPFAPAGMRQYLTAIVGAMLDGRDNYDVRSKQLAGLIEIDPGKVSSTQFEVSDAEKADLYERGVAAASSFFLHPDSSKQTFQLDVLGPQSRLRMHVPSEVQADTEIRFSISALVRIESEGEQLLVQGHRIDQFQPVGGVLKTYGTAREELGRLGVKADSKLPIDQDSRDDLRVFVPRRSVPAFLKWYLESRGRENSPWREFYEELVQPAILSAINFQTPAFDHIGRRVEGIRWTEHFQCFEVLIAEVFALIPTLEQAVELKLLRAQPGNHGILWADAALIRSRGHDSTTQRQVARISEHSVWLLDVEPHSSMDQR